MICLDFRIKKNSEIVTLSKNNMSNLTSNEQDRLPVQVNKTNEENRTDTQSPSTGITE